MRKSLSVIVTSLLILLGLPFYKNNLINASLSGNHIIFNGGTVSTQIQNPVNPGQVDIEVYIRPINVSGIRHILTINDNQQTNYDLGINGGAVSLYYRFATNSSRSVVSGNLNENSWQKINISIGPAATKIFINDVQISSVSGATNLKTIGNKITVGSGFVGDMDGLKMDINTVPYLNWNFDQIRGENTANDSSGNNINGILNGGDIKIHYFGIMPTPSKFILPTLPPIGSIRLSPIVNPTNSVPTSTNPQPTNPIGSSWDRSSRPQLPR